jgi:Transcription factor WhiB
MAFLDRLTQSGSLSSGRSGRELWQLVSARALCARGGVHPDQWLPVGQTAAAARREAADALVLCSGCVVRLHCLELSLRYWTVGQHGVWGGTVPAERAELRQRLAAERESLAPAGR